MTKCKKLKELMPDALADNNVLPEAVLIELREHIKSCPRCAEEYKKLAGLVTVINKRQRPQMSDAFWDNYSLRLEEKLDAAAEADEQKQVTKTAGWKQWAGDIDFKIRWILYPAAAVAILLVGIAIGQYLSLQPGKDLANKAVSSLRQLSPAVAEHFDNIRPLLLDYSNSSPGESTAPAETVWVEKSTVKKLLLENQLLKRVMAKDNNITVKELMDELELILLELANDSGDNEETRRAVQQYIKENDVLFKMKTLDKKDKNTLTI